MCHLFCLFCVWALIAAAPLRAATDCSKSRLAQLSSKVANEQKQLLGIEAEEMDTGVPIAIQQHIHALKDAIAGTTDVYVTCQQDRTMDAKALESRLAQLLGANRPEPTDSHPAPEYGVKEKDIYGAVLKVEVRPPVESLNLIGIEISFGVMCGRDTMLFIFEWQNGTWKRAILWRSADYDTVAGAFGDFFEYLVLPRGAPDDWVVAVAHGHPWCTSRWSGLSLDLIEPRRGDGSKQRVLMHRTAGYDRAPDSEKDAPLLKNEPDGFELRVRDLSLDVFSKTVIYRYKLTADGARRIQPIAMNGRDFVDVWIESDWEEAKDWSASSGRDQLRVEHEELRSLNLGANAASVSFGAVRACSEDRKGFQVELDRQGGAPTFIQIEEGQNSFTVLESSSVPNSHCASPDLMNKH